MKGGESPVYWDDLAPHIEHPTREAIVEAVRWIGPLSVADLKGVLDDSKCYLAQVAYHVTVLAKEGVLEVVAQRPAGASIEKVYSLAPRA